MRASFVFSMTSESTNGRYSIVNDAFDTSSVGFLKSRQKYFVPAGATPIRWNGTFRGCGGPALIRRSRREYNRVKPKKTRGLSPPAADAKDLTDGEITENIGKRYSGAISDIRIEEADEVEHAR